MALWAVWMMFWEAVCHPRDSKTHIFKDKSRLVCGWQWLTHADVVVPREQWQGRYQKSLDGTGMRQQVYGGHTSALDASGRPCRTRGEQSCVVPAWLQSVCLAQGPPVSLHQRGISHRYLPWTGAFLFLLTFSGNSSHFPKMQCP